MTAPVIRTATMADLPTLRALMARAIDDLQRWVLSPEQVAASRAVMGLDTQLIADGTYVVAQIDGAIAGCGGWSRRATLYGGDHSTALREPRVLDPATEPAKVRAMYTDPAFVRRGVGRAVLAACEARARDAGFAGVELMATLAGEPLYLAAGYAPVERVESAPVDGVRVPLVRMGKAL